MNTRRNTRRQTAIKNLVSAAHTVIDRGIRTKAFRAELEKDIRVAEALLAPPAKVVGSVTVRLGYAAAYMEAATALHTVNRRLVTAYAAGSYRHRVVMDALEVIDAELRLAHGGV